MYEFFSVCVLILGFLAACLCLSSVVIRRLTPAKKRSMTILEKVRDLVEEAPEGGIQSVSITLLYKSGATIVLRGPPEKEPSVDRLPAGQTNSAARNVCDLLRREAAYAKVLGL